LLAAEMAHAAYRRWTGDPGGDAPAGAVSFKCRPANEKPGKKAGLIENISKKDNPQR
jgi:hypothetical protein